MKQAVTFLMCSVAAISSAWSAAIGDVSPIASTRNDKPLSADTSAGNITLAAREMQVDIRFPSGKTGRGGMLVLFDPASGRFFWQLTWLPKESANIPMLNNFTSNSRIYLAADRMTVFTCRAPVLLIYDSDDKAKDLQSAETMALQSATNELDAREARTAPRGPRAGRTIPLSVIGNDFLVPPHSAAFHLPVKILNISRSGQKWQVTLQGRWKALLTLSDKDDGVSYIRVP